MVPPSLTIPLLVIATLATIIASQAVISGAFSVTQQAIQLGFMPRLRITHTSSQARGADLHARRSTGRSPAMVALLVFAFRSSAAMLPAYGLAVVGTMLITTLMQYVVVFRIWKRAAVAGGRRLRGVRHRRRASSSPRARQAVRRRLVPDPGRLRHLHRADDLGEGPAADARAAGRSRAAAAGVHQVGGGLGAPGPRHVGVPVDLGRHGPRGAAPQSQAQPGAPRARADPQREGRGSAARRRPRSGSRSTTPATASTG